MTKQVSKNLTALIIGGAVVVGFLAGVAIGLGDGVEQVGFVSLLPCLGALLSLPALLLTIKEERE